MDLSPGEIAALQDLLAKSEGTDVEFVNIGDAQGLTEQGLAMRTPQGWVITLAGRGRLKAIQDEAAAGSPADAPAAPDNIVALRPSPRRGEPDPT